jgi:hypothetical protein
VDGDAEHWNKIHRLVNGTAAPNMSKGVIAWHIKSPESTSTPSRVPTIQVFRLISMSDARKSRCSAASSKFTRRLRSFVQE